MTFPLVADRLSVSLCRDLTLNASARELTGFVYILSDRCTALDYEWYAGADEFTMKLGPWSHGVRLAMFAGLDKLNELIDGMWRVNTSNTVEHMLVVMGRMLPWPFRREFEMLMWNAWPALRQRAYFEVTVEDYLMVRALTLITLFALTLITLFTLAPIDPTRPEHTDCASHSGRSVTLCSVSDRASSL